MPRRNSPVKPKQGVIARSPGAIDIHFHGAFGVDLMTATGPELSELSARLWEHGVAGFCPTTLSTSPEVLLDTVGRLGEWVRGQADQRSKRPRSAVPIGIHLEGPFINSSCCGAHPPGLIRKLDWNELEQLWQRSRETLKILTIAPETLASDELAKLGSWAKDRKVALSLGHSKATENEARAAFSAGFRGITHAWNALGFHQRSPGPLGPALGNRKTYVELIIDQIHVAPTLMQWTQRLHPADRLCFVSDCAPAAETSDGRNYAFGPLQIRYDEGACRLADGAAAGALAGGGKLLTRSFCEWLERSGENSPMQALRRSLRRQIPSITTAPLWGLQIPAKQFAPFQVEWRVNGAGKISVAPA